MKLKELLELTQNEPLVVIAKERLTIGKNTARDALRAAGCYPKNGLRGWFYDGDPQLLEKSIYDFVSFKPGPIGKVSNPESKGLGNTESKKIINQTIQPISKQVEKPKIKKVTYAIEEQLHDELRIRAIREKRTVAEIVNEIIKRALEKE